MCQEILPRRLWHEVDGRVETLTQASLSKLEYPIIVLGEPGMGKTELLLRLGSEPGYAFCTARQLINVRPDPRRLLGNAQTLVIDALDEVTARKEGDAVDLVLQKLGDLGYPNFAISCRAADWRSATNTLTIGEQYGSRKIIVLHLERLSDQEIRHVLASRLAGDTNRADAVIAHFSDANLEGLLGNPQTLGLVARVAADDTLPKNKSELFERAVGILRREHRDEKVDLQPDEETALDAAGAAFAALILTGSEAILTQSAEYAEGELPINEVAALPFAKELSKVLGSRLFATIGAAGRFAYWHRSIGEYLGARWLARLADSVLKRQRLLAVFHSYGTVPASLRGLHAWLAYHSPLLAPAVIAADPMGIVEYGETDALDAARAEGLLASLKDLASRNPHFRRGWRRYSLQGLAQVHLLEPIRQIINDATTGHDLRLLLIEAVKNSAIARSLRPDLYRVGLSATAPLSHRLRAMDALIALGGEDWLTILSVLCKRKSENDNQLCIEIVGTTGSDLYSDAQVIEVAVQYAQFERSHVHAFTRMIDGLSAERLDSLLDELVKRVAASGNRHERKGNNEINDIGYKLIERRLCSGPVNALRLWQWLRPFDEQYGYHRNNRERVHNRLRDDKVLRRAIQRFVLLDEPGSKAVYERAWRLRSRSPAFDPTPDDVCILLRLLDPATDDDVRWRDLLNLIPHSEVEGVEAREIAKRFVSKRPDMLAWIDKLAVTSVPDWKLKREETERRRAAKRAMEWDEHRKSYRPHIEFMRRGEPNLLISPSEVYLGFSYELDEHLTPPERLHAWLGSDIASAALQGFESFLQSESPPSSDQVAESNGESRRWNAIAIIQAGLAERIRLGQSLHDISSDRLITSFYDLQISYAGDQAGKSGLRSAVEKEMRIRGLDEMALEQWIEPQLRHQRQHVEQLFQFMHDPARKKRAAAVAFEWLSKYPEMSAAPEEQMVGRLIDSDRRGDLLSLLAIRMATSLPDDRRGLWDAVAFVADFDGHCDRLAADAAINPALLWAIRERIGGDHGRKISSMLSVVQLVWLLTTFRLVYPVAAHPTGGWSGDRHSWNASDFLSAVASRLAEITSVEAVSALNMLVQAPTDTYTTFFRALAVEQQSKLTEARYRPPRLTEFRAIVDAQSPKTAADLQATIVGLLLQVQDRIRANPADSWVGFYTDDFKPLGEELCRNHLLTMLGEYPEKIDLQPEGHMAQDKRADIISQFGGMRLPVEIKGQWHETLWHAADTQLDRFYTTDYAAERRGIFLVLWFGNQVPRSKKLKSRGRGTRPPSNADKLRSNLVVSSQAAQEGRVEIVVVDCTFPPRE